MDTAGEFDSVCVRGSLHDLVAVVVIVTPFDKEYVGVRESGALHVTVNDGLRCSFDALPVRVMEASKVKVNALCVRVREDDT